MASGSHTKSGICADFPVAPRNKRRQIQSIVLLLRETDEAPAKTVSKFKLPKAAKIKNMPRRNPISPIRLTIKAFFAASPAGFFSYQNPIRRYEQSPTPSQPRNIKTKLSARTRLSMVKIKRFIYAKKRQNPGSPCIYPME